MIHGMIFAAVRFQDGQWRAAFIAEPMLDDIPLLRGESRTDRVEYFASQILFDGIMLRPADWTTWFPLWLGVTAEEAFRVPDLDDQQVLAFEVVEGPQTLP